MNDDTYENNIFGTFRTLTPAQIKDNALFVGWWAVVFLIVIAGVAVAVLTKIVWLAPAISLIGVCLYFFVARNRNTHYVCKFGMKYNILRSLTCGFLVYGGVGWRGLLGFYNYLSLGKGCNLSITSYGWTILAVSLIITLITKLSLYRIVDVQVADLIGLIEMSALGIFIGSIMFLLLYT